MKVIKNAWTAEHEANMLAIQALINESRKTVAWMLVAQRMECSPAHLQKLMEREYKRKCQQMVHVGNWLNKLGGTLLCGKSHEDGECYSWYGEIPMERNYYVALTFGRYHGVDAFDIPLGLEITLMHRRTKRVSVRMAVMCDLDTVDNIADIKSAYKDAVKQILEQYRITPLPKLVAKETA